MEEYKYLTAFRALADRIECLEYLNASYLNDIKEKENEIAALKGEITRLMAKAEVRCDE